jgi:O-methyltransferase
LADSFKFAIKQAIRRTGYQISRIPTKEVPGLYGKILTQSQYTPWNADPAFQNVYETIRPQTKVDVMRCYELWTMIAQSSKLYGAIIEVGTWKGGTTALIANRAAESGISDPIFACDTFAGVVKSSDVDGNYRNGEYADASATEVEELVSKVGAPPVTILQGIFPDDTAHSIPVDMQFRLAHIDVDVYQSAKDCVEWIWPRLVIGGIVVYDDYGAYAERGIAKYVNEQIPASDRLVFYNLNGHGIVIKLK